MKTISILFILLYCGQSIAIDSATETAAEQAAEQEAAIDATAEKETTFTSPNQVTEQCVALAKIPGGKYSKKDRTNENIFCSINFYQGSHALCPKTWSTSPGTMIYDLSESDFTASSYESSRHCGKKAKGAGVSTDAKFKNTMNASGTSGTFSQSSLMYYHFSRYFGTQVHIPVAVYREIDRSVHLSRIANKGKSKSSGMNGKGWNHLVNALKNPKTYSPTDDLFTDDRTKLFGIMIRGKGERYGTEFNGTRASGWGSGQNRDFQKTPGFYALREDSDLLTAVATGLTKAARDRTMAKDLVGLEGEQGAAQVILWMREIIEITLLDYIFSQQDRIGNIDYRWYWAYVDGDKVKYKREKRDEYEELARRRMGRIPVPENLIDKNPILVQKTQLNDNDAGGLYRYANFTKRTKMLEGLKHYSAKTFRKLMALDQDLQNQGPVWEWLKNNVDLTSRRFNQVITNTHLAANLLRAQCKDLRFDLDDVDNYLSRGPRVETVVCPE